MNISDNIKRFIEAFPELKYKLRWTLSTPDKMPLDLDRTTLIKAQLFGTKKYKSNLYDLDTVLKIKEIYPNLEITFRLKKEDNIIAFDLEPELFKNKDKNNIFLYINFDYLEVSKNGGAHGFIRNKEPNYIERDIISLKETHYTEIFTNNHFIIFTGNKIHRKIKNPNNKWYQYLKENDMVKEIKPIKEKDKEELLTVTPLTEIEKYKVDFYMNHFTNLHKNVELKATGPNKEESQSVIDQRVLCIILNTLYNKEYELRTNPKLLKYYTYFIAEELLPRRDKLKKVIRSQKYGTTTYLAYSIEKAYDYLVEKNGW